MGPGQAHPEKGTWVHSPTGPPPTGSTLGVGCIVCRAGVPGGPIHGYQAWQSGHLNINKVKSVCI